ncbi:hypothetical protein LCGC14_1708340 [marine sediment metagenome]|uniref:Uncharacterized protein n=1 Tax=marine sediment metagenome TaxID=412755 RepID=A0A0F9HGF4_9ZZZZ
MELLTLGWPRVTKIFTKIGSCICYNARGASMSDSLCKADPWKPGPNYGKPHVPVQGEYDGKPRLQCLYCGRWLESPVLQKLQ